MEQKRIDRISELTRISRVRKLTPNEETERAQLRTEYIASFKNSLETKLGSIRVADEKGNITEIKKKSIKTDPVD